MVPLDVGVAVPGELVLHAARVDLDEADAALDQPAGGQALAGDVVATGVVDAVEPLDRVRARASMSIASGAADLHAVGQLEALDPRRELGLGGEPFAVELVEPFTRASWARCSAVGHAGGRSRSSIGAPLGWRCVPW